MSLIKTLHTQQLGVLHSWNDTKGFGFIRAHSGDYFVHISSVHDQHRPQQGESVFFIAGKDQQDRLRAESMRSAEPRIDHPSMRRKYTTTAQPNEHIHRQRRQAQPNIKRTIILLVAVCAAPLLGAWQAFQDNDALWPLLIYAGLSMLSIFQYWHDKQNAQNGEWRTPEKQLHTVELLGGWPGALLAQQLLRHKTQKASYQGVFWLIILIHQVYWLDQLAFHGQLLHSIPMFFI